MMVKIYFVYFCRVIYGGCYVGMMVLCEMMCVCLWLGDCIWEWWMEDGWYKEMEIVMKKEICC